MRDIADMGHAEMLRVWADAETLRTWADAPKLVTPAWLGTGRRITEQDARLAPLSGPGGSAPSFPSTPSGLVLIDTKPGVSKRRWVIL